MYELPIDVQIGSVKLHITERGDFRMVLDCFNALQDEEIATEYRIISSLLIFYEEFNDISDIEEFPDIEQAVNEMFNFFNCGEPQQKDNTPSYTLIDWEQDSQLISSAINHVARMEIRSQPYIHWWTFMGWFNAIGECSLSTIVSIRKKIATGKKLEKYEKEFRHDNPQYFNRDFRSVEQKESDKLIQELWQQ